MLRAVATGETLTKPQRGAGAVGSRAARCGGCSWKACGQGSSGVELSKGRWRAARGWPPEDGGQSLTELAAGALGSAWPSGMGGRGAPPPTKSSPFHRHPWVTPLTGVSRGSLGMRVKRGSFQRQREGSSGSSPSGARPKDGGECDFPSPRGRMRGYTAGREVPHPPICDGPLPHPIGRGKRRYGRSARARSSGVFRLVTAPSGQSAAVKPVRSARPSSERRPVAR